MASIGNCSVTQQMLSRHGAVSELGIGMGVAASGYKRGLLGIDLNVTPPEEELDEDGGGEEPLFETTHCCDGGKPVVDSGEEMGEHEKRLRRWNAILRVAEDASAEYEKSQNRKRKMTPIQELQPKKKNPTPPSQCFTSEESNSGYHYPVPPPPLVSRSTRGRTVAMPTKYRDSVLDVPSEGPFFGSHTTATPATAAVIPSKRRPR